jgi:dipeptidase D
VLAKILREFRPFRLVEIQGGTAPNAIPREARATILTDPNEVTGAEAAAKAAAEALRAVYASTDPDLRIFFDEARSGSAFSALSPAVSSLIVDLLLALPNGVVTIGAEKEGFVETSCNLATIDFQNRDRELRVIVTQRSSRISQLDELTDRIEAVASLAGCRTETGRDYPAWPTRLDSPILIRSRKLYEDLFGNTPGIRVVHAGLECGVIGSLRPGIDMISLGPNIENPHSPAERMSKSSVGRCLFFLAQLIRSLAEDPLTATR